MKNNSGKPVEPPPEVRRIMDLLLSLARDEAATREQIVDRLEALGCVVEETETTTTVIVDAAASDPDAEAPLRGVTLSLPALDTLLEFYRRGLRSSGPTRIDSAPGGSLRWVARLFGKRTRERILDPIIADMLVEYYEELASDDPSRPRLWLIRARAWGSLGHAILSKTVLGRILGTISRFV